MDFGKNFPVKLDTASSDSSISNKKSQCQPLKNSIGHRLPRIHILIFQTDLEGGESYRF